MIEGVVAAFIAAQNNITALLPAFGDGFAIFARGERPPDALAPIIKIQSISTRDYSVRARSGSEVRVDVSVYGNRDSLSDDPLRALAMLVKQTLHRCDLAPAIGAAGYECHACIASDPFDHPDEDGFPGQVIQVLVRYMPKLPVT